MADEGIQREATGDDVEQSTYTARTFQLPSGISNEEPPATYQAVAAQEKRQGSIVLHVPGEFPSEDAHESSQQEAGVPAEASKEENNLQSEPLVLTEDKKQDEDHVSRNAALGGAGVTGIAAAGYSQPETTQPSGLLSEPAALTEQKREDEDHANRNTALAGAGVVGVAAAGYGIYSASRDDDKPKEQTLSTEPAKDNIAPVSTETAKPETTQSLTSQPEPITSQPEEKKEDTDDRAGRNAALAGGGVAGVGTASHGAYEATKDDEAEPEPERKKSTLEKLKEKLRGDKVKNDKTKGDTTAAREQKPLEEKDVEDHTGRNAALVGAGAAGGGIAANGVYEVTKDDKQDQAELLKQQEREREQAEKTRKEQDKEAENARKEQEKMAEKDRREQDKDAEKEREKAEKARKQEEKRAEKEHKEQELAAEKTQEQEAERRRLWEEEEQKRQGDDDLPLGRDAAIGGAAVAGAGAVAYEATRDADEGKTNTEKLQEYEATRDVGPKKDPLEKVKSAFTSDKSSEAKEPETHTQVNRGAAPGETGAIPSQYESLAGRDAAVVGGTATFVGGGAVAATYRADDTSYGDRSHPASYDDPNLTPAERLHQYERLRAERGMNEKGAEKKPSLIHRILHPGESSRKSTEPTSPSTSTQQHGQHQHRGTDRRIGDTGNASALPTSKGKQTELETRMRRGSAPPPEEHEGYITLVNPAAPPDAPHVVIRDHPEDK